MTLKTDFSRYEGHTPGPWKVANTLDSDIMTSDAKEAIVYDSGFFSAPYGNPANAVLIADAPLLAARLKAWEEWYVALDKRHDADWGEADVEETYKALDAAKLALMEAYK